MFNTMSQRLAERENSRFHQRMIFESVSGLVIEATDDNDSSGIDIDDDYDQSESTDTHVDLNSWDTKLTDAILAGGLNADTLTSEDLTRLSDILLDEDFY